MLTVTHNTSIKLVFSQKSPKQREKTPGTVLFDRRTKGIIFRRRKVSGTTVKVGKKYQDEEETNANKFTFSSVDLFFMASL